MLPPRRRLGGLVDGTGVDAALQLAIVAGLVIMTGLAWAWTVAMSAMPDCHRIGLSGFLVMWTVMMAAMMFPAVIPVVLAFVAFTRTRGGSPGAGAMLFVAGYLVVWGMLGLPARALLVGAERLVTTTPRLASASGAVLVLCGLYQITPLKDTCLRHCRVPQLFLGHHWRDGLGGALALGAHHGLVCAGCCASLMIVLLVVGMMNLTWMVVLSALIFLEKALPTGGMLGRIAGITLCGLGVAKLIA